MMTKRIVTGLCLMMLTAPLVAGAQNPPAQNPPGRGRGGVPPVIALTSPAFEDGAPIPEKYTRAAQAPVSPPLEWTGAPANITSFVLLFHDADVALGKHPDGPVHWLVLNIPGTARGLPEGVAATAQLPDGSLQLKNVFGQVGYLPLGAAAGPYHHYTFELFALDTRLDVGAEATRADVLKAMDGHVLSKGVLVGRSFHR